MSISGDAPERKTVSYWAARDCGCGPVDNQFSSPTTELNFVEKNDHDDERE